MIVEQITKFKNRDKIQEYTKIIKEDTKSNILQAKIIAKYKYLICDYCKSEIKLNTKKEERTGGIVVFPHSYTNCGKIELALCCKCLNNVIKEFEERNRRKDDKTSND